MYSVYLALAIAAGLSLFYLFRIQKTSDKIGYSAISSVVVGVIWLLGNLLCNGLVSMHEVSYGASELAAVRSSDGISGAFVWCSGGFESSSYYNMLVKNNDGSLSPYKIKATNKVRIIEDENLENVGYWTSTWSESNFDGFWGNWILIQMPESHLIRHEIKVPKGTVVQSFSMN